METCVRRFSNMIRRQRCSSEKNRSNGRYPVNGRGELMKILGKTIKTYTKIKSLTSWVISLDSFIKSKLPTNKTIFERKDMMFMIVQRIWINAQFPRPQSQCMHFFIMLLFIDNIKAIINMHIITGFQIWWLEIIGWRKKRQQRITVVAGPNGGDPWSTTR